MSCKKCEGKGFVESYHAGGNSFTPSIQQCCDIGAYSREVQRRLSLPATDRPVIMTKDVPPPKPKQGPAVVLPFILRKEEKK